MSIKIKEGVSLSGIRSVMLEPILFLNSLYDLAGVDLVITDAVAARGPGSLHPEGYAFDFRIRDLNEKQIDVVFSLLIQRFDQDYDIVRYPTHGHIEYQRYLDDRKIMTVENLKKLTGDKLEVVA